MSNRLSEAYDFTTEYKAEIEPLLKQAHEICSSLNIPCVFSVVYQNTPDEGYQSLKAAHLCGEERTPPSLIVADVSICRGPTAAALAVVMGGLHGGIEESDEVQLDSENVAG